MLFICDNTFVFPIPKRYENYCMHIIKIYPFIWQFIPVNNFFENNIDQCEIHKEMIFPPERERASPRQLHCFVSTIATWKRCNKCALAMEINFPTPFLMTNSLIHDYANKFIDSQHWNPYCCGF